MSRPHCPKIVPAQLLSRECLPHAGSKRGQDSSSVYRCPVFTSHLKFRHLERKWPAERNSQCSNSPDARARAISPACVWKPPDSGSSISALEWTLQRRSLGVNYLDVVSY